jgi:hypothetical protein
MIGRIKKTFDCGDRPGRAALRCHSGIAHRVQRWPHRE